ncbi:MAG: class I SAM-dependent methyltransferase [Parachlamydiales bacterium]|nr:class I SAM-dependent methyltransferase [Parachlamydiales bacterium]
MKTRILCGIFCFFLLGGFRQSPSLKTPALVGLRTNPSLKTAEEVKKVVCQGLPTLEGWCSCEKATKMMDLIIHEYKNKEPVCVEIGVFGGASILPTAMALKFNGKGIVHAIDPWETLDCLQNYVQGDVNYEWWKQVDLRAIYQSYRNMLKKYDIESYCHTIKSTSRAVANSFDRIDILHIDGNHSELASLEDVVTFLPKVQSGGYIWMDDCGWPTTRKAVEYLSRFSQKIDSVDNGNCLLFRKF